MAARRENTAVLIARQQQSQRAFYRALASGSPEAALLEFEGVQATVVPVRGWFSIFNSAFYRDRPDLEGAYPSLAADYGAAVKAWTVWVPPGEARAAAFLQSQGHVLDSTPMLFAASIDSLDLEQRRQLDLDPAPTWDSVAAVNDRAHGVLEEWSMGAIFQTMSDPASRLHIAREDGAPAAALIAREYQGDCYFWFVATVPEARRRGIASELMRHAVRDAAGRGCTTSSLESSKVAEPMYQGLGYLPLGRYEMWELRTA